MCVCVCVCVCVHVCVCVCVCVCVYIYTYILFLQIRLLYTAYVGYRLCRGFSCGATDTHYEHERLIFLMNFKIHVCTNKMDCIFKFKMSRTMQITLRHTLIIPASPTYPSDSPGSSGSLRYCLNRIIQNIRNMHQQLCWD